MFVIIGMAVVLASVVGGYLMEHGNLSVLIQPAEIVIIFGAATGALIISSPPKVLSIIAKNLGKIISAKTKSKSEYIEALALLNSIFTKMRKEGPPGTDNGGRDLGRGASDGADRDHRREPRHSPLRALRSRVRRIVHPHGR